MGSNILLNSLAEGYAVELYDMEITDVEERRQKKLHFDKAYQAANFLGMIPQKFYERIGIGKYAYHRITGKQYAVRKVGQAKPIT